MKLWNLVAVVLHAAFAVADIQLFSNGQVGPLLGLTFGVSGRNATLDYVVVGGGTAGVAIATRLSSAPGISVALIEPGSFYEIDNGNLSVIAGNATYFTGTAPSNFQPLTGWAVNTTPQPNYGNRTIHYARGKTLGGSSARNYMVYQRGTRDSYQMWADQVGDQSYTFENIPPFFKKSVQYTPPDQALYTNSFNNQTPTAFSPDGGPLQVSFGGKRADPTASWSQLMFEKLGMTEFDGYNSGELIGSGYATFTIDPQNSHRSSAESSFSQAAIQENVSPMIYHQTQAQQILFDTNKTATGVLVSTAGTFGTPSVTFTLTARKEVILSAGAFRSPQLLVVSDNGPCAQLSSFSIPCLVNLTGVGRNMWDHHGTTP